MSVLSKHQRSAGRAYGRVLSQITEGWDNIWAADRQFDGGEWSDEVWDKNFAEAEERAAKIVGERFGLNWQKVITIAEYEMPMDWFDHFSRL